MVCAGGQYDCGTTDVTRTFHLGEPSKHQKVCFTRVLQVSAINSPSNWLQLKARLALPHDLLYSPPEQSGTDDTWLVKMTVWVHRGTSRWTGRSFRLARPVWRWTLWRAPRSGLWASTTAMALATVSVLLSMSMRGPSPSPLGAALPILFRHFYIFDSFYTLGLEKTSLAFAI